MLRVIVAMVLFALAFGGTASAVPLTVGQYVTSGNFTYTLLQCSGTGNDCNSGQFTAVAGTEAIKITGASGGPIMSITSGAADTFLVFSVTAPIQSVASIANFAFSLTGCGGNTGYSGCTGTTTGSTAYTTVYTYSDAGLTNQVASSSLSISSAASTVNVNTVGALQVFSPLATVYVKFDLGVLSVNSGLAQINSVTLAVPEPASAALLVFGLTGLAALRRRRR